MDSSIEVYDYLRGCEVTLQCFLHLPLYQELLPKLHVNAEIVTHYLYHLQDGFYRYNVVSLKMGDLSAL